MFSPGHRWCHWEVQKLWISKVVLSKALEVCWQSVELAGPEACVRGYLRSGNKADRASAAPGKQGAGSMQGSEDGGEG